MEFSWQRDATGDGGQRSVAIDPPRERSTRGPFIFRRANLRTAIVLPFRRRKKLVPTEPPRIVGLLRQAEEWRQALDSGAVASRAALARREGCSAMRVTQVLALLDLDGEVLDMIRPLPAGTPERLVTERWLRTLRGLSAQSQRDVVRRRVVGYARAAG